MTNKAPFSVIDDVHVFCLHKRTSKEGNEAYDDGIPSMALARAFACVKNEMQLSEASFAVARKFSHFSSPFRLFALHSRFITVKSASLLQGSERVKVIKHARY